MHSLLRNELGPHRERPHMLQEIYAQPEAIRETLRQHWGGNGDPIRFDRSSISPDELRDCARVLIAASGASRHVGIYAQLLIEELAGIPVSVEFASEFCNRTVAPATNSLAVFITQSGETADTTAAQRIAREMGYKTVAITNVVGSTIAKEADAVLYTYAGKERAIPATKSFTASLVAAYLLALALAAAKERCVNMNCLRRLDELAALADSLEASLPQMDADARAAASALHRQNNWILLGRGVHYPVALEGALKLMETAYVSATAFPSGEFRHGPAAVLDGSQVVVGVVCQDANDEGSAVRYRKSLELIDELSPVTGLLVLVGAAGDPGLSQRTSQLLKISPASEFLLPIIAVVPLQLLAYHIARMRGLDVDHPRSLVKSVQSD